MSLWSPGLKTYTMRRLVLQERLRNICIRLFHWHPRAPTLLYDSRGLGSRNDLSIRPTLIFFENVLSDSMLNSGEIRARVDSRSTFSNLSVNWQMISSRDPLALGVLHLDIVSYYIPEVCGFEPTFFFFLGSDTSSFWSCLTYLRWTLVSDRRFRPVSKPVDIYSSLKCCLLSFVRTIQIVRTRLGSSCSVACSSLRARLIAHRIDSSESVSQVLVGRRNRQE